MPKYSDVKLAEQMSKVAERLQQAAYSFDCELEYASIVYDDIAIPSYSSGVEEIIVRDDVVERSVNAAHENLKRFDRELGKLLALRMTLAEETGIPMNLTGASEWSRLIEYYL